MKTSNVQHPWHRANYGDDAPEKVRALIEIPQTLELDGDPLDILVLCSQTIQPLCLVDATIDPSENHIKNIEQMPPHFIRELRHYFEQYKVLEHKEVRIDNFQKKEETFTIILNAIELHKKIFSAK